MKKARTERFSFKSASGISFEFLVLSLELDSIREIQVGVLAEMVSCGFVVCFGGLGFAVEAAEVGPFSADSEHCFPGSAFSVEGDAFVLREAS